MAHRLHFHNANVIYQPDPTVYYEGTLSKPSLFESAKDWLTPPSERRPLGARVSKYEFTDRYPCFDKLSEMIHIFDEILVQTTIASSCSFGDPTFKFDRTPACNFSKRLATEIYEATQNSREHFYEMIVRTTYNQDKQLSRITITPQCPINGFLTTYIFYRVDQVLAYYSKESVETAIQDEIPNSFTPPSEEEYEHLSPDPDFEFV